ncbi:MAG: patatin-like phospholipase family protein [Symbiobacteriaceae bacterium]
MIRLAQAVFKGGGVKGIALVGALAVAEELGWRWRAVAGTSAGGLVAALVAAGYRAEALREIIHDLDLRSFGDAQGLKVTSLLLHEGIFKGEKLLAEVDRLLSDRLGRPRVTFRDLPVACQIVATDLTHRRLLVFPHDLGRPPYSLEDPYDFPVADAVRASTAIPFFFQPYRLELPNGVRATLVDGGLLSNFPVHLFQPIGGPACVPTFGFDLRGTYWAAREGQAIVGPDFLVGWIGFSDEGPANAGLIRLMGGVRLAFPSRDVRPSIYGRAGFQGLRHRHWHHLHHWHGPLDFTAALALEGGGAIDFAVAPNVTLGGHAGLNLLTSGHAYLNLGAHLAGDDADDRVEPILCRTGARHHVAETAEQAARIEALLDSLNIPSDDEETEGDAADDTE